MKQYDQFQQVKLDVLKRELEVGISQVENGKGVEFDSKGMKSLIKDIKAQGRSKVIRENNKS